MNIAVNCRLLQKGKLEGIGWFMYETLKRITTAHPEHEFYFIFDRPFNKEFIFSGNVHPVVIGPPTRHPLLWYFWFEWRIPSLLRKIKADIFFTPDGYVSLRSGVPVVTVIHDINFAHRPKDLPFWTRFYYNHFFPKFAKKAHRICTVSEYSKKDISITYNIPTHNINVVYNGANPDFRPVSAEEKQKIKDKYSDGMDYFLFIGSLHPRKNLENLIKAYKLFVQNEESDIKLIIVGAAMWSDNHTYKRLVGSDDESRIIFTGRLESEDLGNLLSAAYALTFVPWFEGFGIPVLEALYCEIPVLTSTETSLPEVGGKAALYAHPSDVSDIAAKMSLIAKDQKVREELIIESRIQKSIFSWDQTADKVWQSIEKTISDIDNK